MKTNTTLLQILVVAGVLNLTPAQSCTRFTYEGADGNVLTGRNFDWDRGFNNDLWVLPAGLKRSGQAGRSAADPFHGPNDLPWVSKYGSIVVASNGGIGEGMNVKGLSGSFNMDVFAEYPKPSPDRKDVNVAFLLQYLLDNFATVDEAIKALDTINVIPMPVKLPNGAGYNLILAITDASGDNAVIQWEKGTAKIYHGKQYNVMTNESSRPALNYGDMQAVREYYRGINSVAKATVSLPGSYSSEDRIARIGYYLDNTPKASDIDEARAWTFRILRSAATGMPFPEFNIPTAFTTTGWGAVADLKKKRYYIDVPQLLAPYYVDLEKFDLNPGAPMRKLAISTTNGQEKPATMMPYSGDVTKKLKVSKPDATWDLK
jgi:penicillin V acylase-like amidase (Ntn superfamily)